MLAGKLPIYSLIRRSIFQGLPVCRPQFWTPSGSPHVLENMCRRRENRIISHSGKYCEEKKTVLYQILTSLGVEEWRVVWLGGQVCAWEVRESRPERPRPEASLPENLVSGEAGVFPRAEASSLSPVPLSSAGSMVGNPAENYKGYSENGRKGSVVLGRKWLCKQWTGSGQKRLKCWMKLHGVSPGGQSLNWVKVGGNVCKRLWPCALFPSFPRIGRGVTPLRFLLSLLSVSVVCEH